MNLTDWFAARDTVRRVYREELGRDVAGDPDALANWLYHWREEGADGTAIRAMVRDSDEWRAKHPVSGGSNGWLGIPMNCADTSVRGNLFGLDPPRGPFQFPAPWDTTGIRLTLPEDGDIEPIGYSYWANCNNSAGRGEMIILVGRTNEYPLLFSLDKRTLAVSKAGTLPLNGNGERWYFSKTNPDWLYVDESMSSDFVRCDLRTGGRETIFSVTPDRYFWQGHSSADDQAHSATVRDRATYEMLGALVHYRGEQLLFPKKGDYDECQIDQSGEWLVIKEDSNNRVINLATREERVILNAQGAVGHSDNGFGYAVGEDDMSPKPGLMRLWDLASLASTEVYWAHEWSPTSRHVSHLNAVAAPAAGQRAFLSSTCRVNSPRANEIVSFALDGSGDCTVHAPTMCSLDSQPGDDYRKLPKGNVDPTGEFFIWSANCGGPRTDVFLVKVR